MSSGTMTSFDPASVVPPAHSADALMGLESSHGVGVRPALPIAVSRGRGAWVQDTVGRRYLDLISGHGALNHGHRHPTIVAALKAQADRLTRSAGGFHNDQLGPFLARLTDATGFSSALAVNTDFEALQVAAWLARSWANQTRSVPLEQSQVVVVGGSDLGSPPQLSGPGVVPVPFGDLEALNAAIGPNTAAIVMAFVQSTAGIEVASQAHVERTRQLCSERGAWLIADERETGLGRTGHLFGFEHSTVRPDCAVVGCALGGGVYPVSAIVGDGDFLHAASTMRPAFGFGVGPLGAAVGLAALNVMHDEGLCARSARLGALALERLRGLDSAHVRSVRGCGLLIGVEIEPESGPARTFCEALLERGVLCRDAQSQVIRLVPPLTIDEDDWDYALSVIAEVLG